MMVVSSIKMILAVVVIKIIFNEHWVVNFDISSITFNNFNMFLLIQHFLCRKLIILIIMANCLRNCPVFHKSPKARIKLPQ